MVALTVNGAPVDVAVQLDKPLPSALREDLGLLGPEMRLRHRPVRRLPRPRRRRAILQAVAGRIPPFILSADDDALIAEGLNKQHYAIPNRRLRSRHVPSQVPIGVWRSNGFSFNTFFSASFVAECAAAAGRDPLDYRRALLRDRPRHLPSWTGPQRSPVGAGRGSRAARANIVPTAAAIGNAIFAATGRRLRALPFAVTETIGERRTRSVLRAGA